MDSDAADPRPCGACLVLKHVPKIPQRVVLAALKQRVRSRIANTFFRYPVRAPAQPAECLGVPAFIFPIFRKKMNHLVTS